MREMTRARMMMMRGRRRRRRQRHPMRRWRSMRPEKIAPSAAASAFLLSRGNSAAPPPGLSPAEAAEAEAEAAAAVEVAETEHERCDVISACNIWTIPYQPREVCLPSGRRRQAARVLEVDKRDRAAR